MSVDRYTPRSPSLLFQYPRVVTFLDLFSRQANQGRASHPGALHPTEESETARMSLNIDIDDVSAVLLADGWHPVAGQSFDLDSYEFKRGDLRLLGGGACPGVPHTGFSFLDEDGDRIDGPLTALLAVRRYA